MFLYLFEENHPAKCVFFLHQRQLFTRESRQDLQVNRAAAIMYYNIS